MSKQLRVQVTDEQFQEILQLAEPYNMTPSQYVRSVLTAAAVSTLPQYQHAQDAEDTNNDHNTIPTE